MWATLALPCHKQGSTGSIQPPSSCTIHQSYLKKTVTIKFSFLSNHHFSHIFAPANSSSPKHQTALAKTFSAISPRLLKCDFHTHSEKGYRDQGKREWRGKEERRVETTIALKLSEFSESILEGMRDQGQHREASTVSLFSSLSLSLSLYTASQIKWPPLCPPTPHKLRTFTPHFYVQVQNILPHLVVLVLSVMTLSAASHLDSDWLPWHGNWLFH